jgi:hypothetical protein
MMKKLSFNILKYNQTSNEPLEVDEFSFWKYYLEILQIKSGRFLTPGELNVIAFIFAGTPNKSYFKAPSNQELMEVLNLAPNNFHRIKYSLEEKGVIVPTEIWGDYVLNPRLVEYQKAIKEKLNEGVQIEYIMNFKLKKMKKVKERLDKIIQYHLINKINMPQFILLNEEEVAVLREELELLPEEPLDHYKVFDVVVLSEDNEDN